MRRAAIGLALALALVAGCAADQEPDLVPPSGSGPSTTSKTLSACPPGGPDATTPAAGCVGPHGKVERP